MPSAANVKVEKQPTISTSDTSSSDSTLTSQNPPIKQAIVVLEHKIRNLEKRKAKLEGYRDLQNSGKELNQDQQVAVAKYDEVLQTLDFARELCKQFQSIASVSEKETKKNARKEAAAKSQQELVKIREVLLVQDALQQLGNETVRADFLYGRNGAVALSESDLKLLDDIYPEVSPRHELGSPAHFTSHVQTAAEHMLAVVDGKSKEAFGSTYAYIKEVIGKVHESGYFDQPIVDSTAQEYIEEVYEAVEETEQKVEDLTEIPLEGSIPVYHVEPTIPQEEVPVIVAPPVLEQQYFQQPRPITEVLGSGTFYFLQDSELDSPDQIPANPVLTNAAIPSQTFTNQNFVSMADSVVPRPNAIAGFTAPSPNPPPPIPMPPSHMTGMEFANVAPMQAAPMGYTNYQPNIIQDELQHPMETVVMRNGEEIVKQGDDPHSGSPKNAPRSRNNGKRTGPPGHGPNAGGNGGYHQSYYQHNNGYSNRPRPGRGGNTAARSGNRPPMHHNVQNKQKQAQQH